MTEERKRDIGIDREFEGPSEYILLFIQMNFYNLEKFKKTVDETCHRI
jgi:hypothetical protein